MDSGKKKEDAVVTCHECGQPMERRTKVVTVRYQGLTKDVEVTGRYCTRDDCDGSLLIGKEGKPIEQAMLSLKAQIEGLLGAGEIVRIRKKLGLTQRQASDLLGGGPNSFNKYECGSVFVSRPMNNLLRLLDQDPGLLKHLYT